MRKIGLVDVREEEFFLMIPGEKDDVEFLLQRNEIINHALRIRTAVNVITHEDNLIPGLGINRLPNQFKHVQTSVNISNRKRSHVRGASEF
jgi:hypothetical protein